MIKRIRRFPKLQHFIECTLMAIGFALVAVTIKPDLISLDQAPSLQELAIVALIAVFVPAFGEELVFRGLLLPVISPFWLTVSITLFVAWHPLESVTHLHNAKSLFTDLSFLFLVAVLGNLCAFAYHRSQSLWSAVYLHWLVVVGWRAAGGARFVV
ncbi:MAG: CPBP family glutamic-type intramembrane protease [Pseudomonadota bacterium]